MLKSEIEVLYHGAIWGGTGYSEAARNAVLALHGAGVRIGVDPSGFTRSIISVGKHKITVRRHQTNRSLKLPREFIELMTELRYRHVNDDAPMVIHAPTPVLHRYRNGRRMIGYTAWETSAMPRVWVDGANVANEIWIPSFHCLKVLKESGVRVPIFVVPHAIDTERFKPADVRLNGTFTFISVFRWGLRKGWPELFTAYERAFTADDPVILRVLTNFREAEHRAQAEQIKEHFKQARMPRLEILPLDYVGYDFLPLLYQNADVFVLPSRGEGFCLPCAEAMACGLPAIVTNSTGTLDYVDGDNGYPVGYRVETADDRTDPDRDATAWTVADIDDLVEKMKQSVDDSRQSVVKGQRARQTIAEKFGFARIARIMMERLAANS